MTHDPSIDLAFLTTILFVPGDRPELAEKAAKSDADAVCLDLEDAVSVPAKTAARSNLAASAKIVRDQGKMVIVRVNNETTLLEADVAAACLIADGLVLPKAADIEQCRAMHDLIALLAPTGGPQPKLIAQIEEAKAVFAFTRCDFSELGKMVAALTVGTEDLSVDMNCEPDAPPMRTAFDMMAMAAAAAKLPLLGYPGTIAEFTDLEKLGSLMAEGKRRGAQGAFCIHPRQIAVAQSVFGPTAEEISYAKKVKHVFEAAGNSGRGAVNLDGRMIDKPIYMKACRTLKQTS